MKLIDRLNVISMLVAGALPGHASGSQLTPEKIQELLEVKGEIFVFDASGKRVEMVPNHTYLWRRNSKSGPMETSSGSQNSDYGGVFLHQIWKVEADGSIHATIEEYAHREEGKGMTGLLQSQEYTIENFAPIILKIQNNHEKNVVVRLTPFLREEDDPADFTDLPVAGKEIVVTDNQGFAWADRTYFNGIFVGMRTHRGTLAMSYHPFKGATEMGVARGNAMELQLTPKLKVTVRSETPFLPDTVSAKVYGFYQPDKKSSAPNSVSTFDSDKEERFLNNLSNQ